MTMAASSTAAMGLAVPVGELLRSGTLAHGAKPWLALAVVVFICAFMISARR
jgi:hypothetical protein